MIIKNSTEKQMRSKQIEVVEFENKYLKEATEVFVNNYKVFRSENPLMPEKYQEKEVVIQLLDSILKENYGVIALSEDRVVGYLTGMIIPEFKSSQKGVYTPEWAHGAVADGSNEIYQAMYKKIYSNWQNDHCFVHALTILEDRKNLINQLFWMGYGMLVMDAVRGVEAGNAFRENDLTIRLAEEEDKNQLKELLTEHLKYMKSGPTFLNVGNANVTEEVNEWFEDPLRMVWVAEYQSDILGYMHTVSQATNACTVVRDEKTLSIQGTHVREVTRAKGVGEALLKNANEYALENGYKRLSVDFESANDSATRFWLKHFHPVCYSLIRYIDDRDN